jgi:hypothetical protein
MLQNGLPMPGTGQQGDQIGRNLAFPMGGCLNWAIFLIKKQLKISGNFFLHILYISIFLYKDRALILIKMGWATFWAFFHKLIWSP